MVELVLKQLIVQFIYKSLLIFRNLETPWYGENKDIAPYKDEIAVFRVERIYRFQKINFGGYYDNNREKKLIES